MSNRLHRSLLKTPVKAATAQGIWITDESGNRYIDGSGGAAVMSIGHGERRVIDAMHAQLDELHYVHAGFFTSGPAEALASALSALAPESLNHVYFASGGSEGIEAILKLTRQYRLETGHPERTNIIGRWHGFHGATLGALSAGGFHRRRANYAPMLFESHHILPAYAYRNQQDGETEQQYGLRMADLLETEILRLGPETVSAFIAETVVGATLGTVPAPQGYFARIREICDRYDVLLVLDEVMCGSGRTGTFFAFEQEGIVPDIVVIAKGLSAGYYPISAALIGDKIVEGLASGSGTFTHGYTHEANPVACTAALAVLKTMAEDDLVANARRQGDRLQRGLEARLGSHPNIGDIRGRGLFRSIEIVQDKDTKEPFDPALNFAGAVAASAREHGLLLYAETGILDTSPGGAFGGDVGDHVLIAPPYTVTDADVDEIVERLAAAVESVLVPVA